MTQDHISGARELYEKLKNQTESQMRILKLDAWDKDSVAVVEVVVEYVLGKAWDILNSMQESLDDETLKREVDYYGI